MTTSTYKLTTISGKDCFVQVLHEGNTLISWDYPTKPNEAVIGLKEILDIYNILSMAEEFANAFVTEEYINGWKYTSFLYSPTEDINYYKTISHELFDEYKFIDGSSVMIIPTQVGSSCYVR